MPPFRLRVGAREKAYCLWRAGVHWILCGLLRDLIGIPVKHPPSPALARMV
jgi:hypothetical protein